MIEISYRELRISNQFRCRRGQACHKWGQEMGTRNLEMGAKKWGRAPNIENKIWPHNNCLRSASRQVITSLRITYLYDNIK